MKKHPKIVLLVIILLSFIIAITIRFFNIKGYYDEATEVYRNNYLNLSIITPPTFYIDKDLTASKNNLNEINLFKMSNYVYEEQEVNDKVDIIATAKSLDLDFEKYCREILINESKKTNTQPISKVSKEDKYTTQEYKNKDWYYKIYLVERKGYIINITIKYKDINNKELYLSYIDYITGLE